MTPHIEASKSDISPVVLMPGDPLRSKFIAENFLSGARLVNNVRGVQGYTGTYKGAPVTVMASGMGMPSMGIYSYELFNVYGVERIIRVGTAGGLTERVKIRDVVAALGASTNSSYAANQFKLHGQLAATADFGLLAAAVEAAKALGIELKVGNVFSTDNFYDDSDTAMTFAKLGALAVEMEVYALYTNAHQAGKQALAICTISDHLVTRELTTPEERQTTFTDMMKIALQVATVDS